MSGCDLDVFFSAKKYRNLCQDGEKIEDEIIKNPEFEEGEHIMYAPSKDLLNKSEFLQGHGACLFEITSPGERIYEIVQSTLNETLRVEFLMRGMLGEGIWSDNERVPKKVSQELLWNKEFYHDDGVSDLALLFGTRGNYNIMTEAASNHVDSFGADKLGHPRVKETLENGLDTLYVKPCKDMALPKSGSVAQMGLIPGALFMVALDTATTRDENIKIIDFHNDMHCVVQHRVKEESGQNPVYNESKSKKVRRKMKDKEYVQRVDRATKNRGCWWDGKLYPDGGSIIDWDSKYVGNSATDIRV